MGYGHRLVIFIEWNACLTVEIQWGSSRFLLDFCVGFQNEKYGLNICGEGGEYETFTLDCPLFTKSVIM